MKKHNKEEIMIVEEWLQQAERDYKAALLLGSDEESGIFERACFHCQQAVEKFLKALILYNGGNLRKIHSLEALREDLKNSGIDVFTTLVDDDIKLLDPYYIGGRYPLAREPDYEDATKAIKIVEKMKRFVEHEAGLTGINFDKSWWESV